MHRLSVLMIGLSVLAVGCGSSSPTDPSQGTTTTSTFTVPLSPANEVPAITNADASGSGTAIVEFWSVPSNRTVESWAEHQDIDDVMLAVALEPRGCQG